MSCGIFSSSRREVVYVGGAVGGRLTSCQVDFLASTRNASINCTDSWHSECCRGCRHHVCGSGSDCKTWQVERGLLAYVRAHRKSTAP